MRGDSSGFVCDASHSPAPERCAWRALAILRSLFKVLDKKMFESYQDIFSKRADSYHAAMEACPDARAEEFEHAVRALALDPHGLICDVPAGGGYLRDYVPVPAEFTFVETSSYFAERCPRGEGCRVVEGSLESLPLATDSTDYALSLAAFHHLPDKEATLREFARVVRPGGRVVVADVEEGTGTGRFLNEFVDEFNSMGHEGRFLDEDFYGAFSSAGLKLREVRRPDLRWRFGDEIEMASFCRRLFGLDLATDGDVIDGIRKHLGYAKDGAGVAMEWQLSYAVADLVES